MIDLAYISSFLRFDREKCCFYWKERPGDKRFNTLMAGKVAGRITAHGYRQIKIKGACYYEHRLVWLFCTGAWPSKEIDHMNLVRSDNRFENLRLATREQNTFNTPRNSANTTGFKGVTHGRGGRFRAMIRKGGKKVALGTFETAAEAHEVYAKAARRLRGEFARA